MSLAFGRRQWHASQRTDFEAVETKYEGSQWQKIQLHSLHLFPNWCGPRLFRMQLRKNMNEMSAQMAPDSWIVISDDSVLCCTIYTLVLFSFKEMRYYFLVGRHRPLFIIFILFTQLQNKNCRLLWDPNSHRRIRW